MKYLLGQLIRSNIGTLPKYKKNLLNMLVRANKST